MVNQNRRERYLLSAAIAFIVSVALASLFEAAEQPTVDPAGKKAAGDAYHHRRMGDAKRKSRSYDAATKEYLRALEKSRTDVERMAAYERLARLAGDEKDNAGAADYLKKAFDACPQESPRRWKLFGKYIHAEAAAGRHAEAEKDARRILENLTSLEDKIIVWRSICELRVELGTVDALVAECRKAGENLEGLVGIAEAHRVKQDSQKLRETLERIAQEYPEYIPAKEELFTILQEGGQEGQAVKLLEELAGSATGKDRQRYAKLLIERYLKRDVRRVDDEESRPHLQDQPCGKGCKQ